jgi:DNA (cytosine-5)-methyltransferase 1
MRHLDLFTGIGGFAYAAQQVWDKDYEPIAFCEIDKFCQKVLKKHWPDVEIINDIRKIKKNRWGKIDIITGGFPCQPFSVAGKRRGENDDRYIWPEMHKVIELVQPTWVICENVTGIIGLALKQVLSDLENIGYDFPRTEEGRPIVFTIPACALNAPHRRIRIWVVAHSTSNGRSRWGALEQGRQVDISKIWATPQDKPLWKGWECIIGEIACSNWIEIATHLCGVVYGIPNRVDRLKALGNAIVPQVAMVIMEAIKEIESKPAYR